MTAAMRLSATDGDMRPRGNWHNALPAWITDDDGYRRLRAGARHTLQMIANTCNPRNDAGDLVGAFGGSALVEACGCGRSTFWRHVGRLEALGYLVVLTRGGVVGDRTYGNVYAIPGRRGSMDRRRVVRRLQVMRPGADGKHRPEVIEPGEQAALWAGDDGGGGSVKMTRGVVSKRDGGSVKMGHHHSPRPYPNKTPCAHGVSMKRSGKGGKLPGAMAGVTEAELRDTGALLRRFAAAAASGGGAIDTSEHGRLMFVAAACRALRVADNPPAMFCAIVRHRRWLYLAGEDEQAAVARLRSYESGPRGKGGSRATPSAGRRETANPGGYSRDARAVELVMNRMRGAGDHFPGVGKIAGALRQVDESWTVGRVREALDELAGGRA